MRKAWLGKLARLRRRTAMLVGAKRHAIERFRWTHLSKRHPPLKRRVIVQHAPTAGRDRFLFHRDHDIIEQLSGRLTYDPDEFACWMAALHERTAWCEARSIAVRHLFVPEKHVVYSDKLPRHIRVVADRPASRILAAADPYLSDRLLYPLPDLVAARARRETFFRTDTHWTEYGAFITYRALIESLSRDIHLEADVEADMEWPVRSYTGDLGVRYEPERSEQAAFAKRLAPLAYTTLYKNMNFDRGAVHVFENARSDLPRCVMFRDSFANFLIPHLMRGFSRLVAVSSLSCYYDLIESERPDVVIVQAIERFLCSLGTGESVQVPQDQAGPSFADYTGVELAFIAGLGRGGAATTPAKATQSHEP